MDKAEISLAIALFAAAVGFTTLFGQTLAAWNVRFHAEALSRILNWTRRSARVAEQLYVDVESVVALREPPVPIDDRSYAACDLSGDLETLERLGLGRGRWVRVYLDDSILCAIARHQQTLTMRWLLEKGFDFNEACRLCPEATVSTADAQHWLHDYDARARLEADNLLLRISMLEDHVRSLSGPPSIGQVLQPWRWPWWMKRLRRRNGEPKEYERLFHYWRPR